MMRYAEADVLSVEDSARTVVAVRKQAHRADFSHIERRPGYLYVRTRAISSRINKNFDAFPAEEIKAAYHTFMGKPVFVNHHNSDHRRARGVIVGVALHEDTNPNGTPDTWVELLEELDETRFPILCAAVRAGDVARTSMGCSVGYTVCSICGNRAEFPSQFCGHIPHSKGLSVERVTASGTKESLTVAEICHNLAFFEDSLLVEDPADPTAVAWVDDLQPTLAATASLSKTASVQAGRSSSTDSTEDVVIAALIDAALTDLSAPHDPGTVNAVICPVCNEGDFENGRCIECGFIDPNSPFADPDTDARIDADDDPDDYDGSDDPDDDGDDDEILDLVCDECGATFGAETQPETDDGSQDEQDQDAAPYQAGDTCPACNQGTLQQVDPDQDDDQSNNAAKPDTSNIPPAPKKSVSTLRKSASTRNVVIGWTKQQELDQFQRWGPYQQGWPQYTLPITVDYDGSDENLCEIVFGALNNPYPQGLAKQIQDQVNATGFDGSQSGHYSLSVGDTVTVDGIQYAVEDFGFGKVSTLSPASKKANSPMSTTRRQPQSGRRSSSQTKTAVSLSGVGIVDRNGLVCKGTDPSGNVVYFRVSQSEMNQLASILFGDLAINFSGVDVDESDIIPNPTASTSAVKAAHLRPGQIMVSSDGRSRMNLVSAPRMIGPSSVRVSGLIDGTRTDLDFSMDDTVTVTGGYLDPTAPINVKNPWNNSDIICPQCGSDTFYDAGRENDIYNWKCSQCGNIVHTPSETYMSGSIKHANASRKASKMDPKRRNIKQADVVGDIMAYESGEMDQDETIKFFQGLIDSGLAWQLQGSYGRTAQSLIDAGLCTAPDTTASLHKRADVAETDTCQFCHHGIGWDPTDQTWVAPDAGTDIENGDGIWREYCPDNHTEPNAPHIPAFGFVGSKRPNKSSGASRRKSPARRTANKENSMSNQNAQVTYLETTDPRVAQALINRGVCQPAGHHAAMAQAAQRAQSRKAQAKPGTNDQRPHKQADDAAPSDQQAAAPDATTTVDTPGATTTDQQAAAPDATTDVETPSAPDGVDPNATKVDVDINATEPSTHTMGSARFVAAQRLARHQVKAGVESGDDLVLAQKIAQSDMSDEAMRAQIQVYEAMSNTKSVSKSRTSTMVPRGGQRNRASLVSDTPSRNVQASAEDNSEWMFGLSDLSAVE